MSALLTLQFVAADDPASRAIQIFERGWPSHVDAIVENGLLGARSDTVGGKPPGVQIRFPGYSQWSRIQKVSLAVSDDEYTAWLNFLSAQIGKPYDMTAIAAFPFERDWREDDSWFCSELQAAALEACGFFPKPLANPANEITPRDLLLLVSPWAQ